MGSKDVAKIQKVGYCRICGQHGQLSFEHVPPRAAFNNRPVIVADYGNFMDLGPYAEVRGRVQQRGAGEFTLCGKCNNDTGAWYGPSFVDWCYQGMDLLIRSNGKPSLIYLNHIFPLRVMKQITTMFFSVNGPQFRLANEELVHFVLNKEAKYLNPKYRIFAYYVSAGRYRFSGISALLNIKTGKRSTFSEIAFPPYGYVLTMASEPPDRRLYEITSFARYDYSEHAVMPLKLPPLETHMAIPGDYRDKNQIYRESGMHSQSES